MDIIEILKTLGDENRMRILNLLYMKKKMCVCDIEETLGLTQSNASRHLTRLKKEKLITSEKKAQWVNYTINEDFLNNHPFVIEILENELKKSSFNKDIEKLSCNLTNSYK
jgi:ArsR family transcriptional regulator